jgi:hypothetical protein
MRPLAQSACLQTGHVPRGSSIRKSGALPNGDIDHQRAAQPPPRDAADPLRDGSITRLSLRASPRIPFAPSRPNRPGPQIPISRASGTATPSSPAVSSLAAFPTPAAGVRSTVRERPASENLHTSRHVSTSGDRHAPRMPISKVPTTDAPAAGMSSKLGDQPGHDLT